MERVPRKWGFFFGIVNVMNIRQKLKQCKAFFPSQPRWAVIAAVGFVVIAITGTVAYAVTQTKTATPDTATQSPTEVTQNTSLAVTSTPAGVNIGTDRTCSDESENLTPFACSMSSEAIETTLIAPQQADIDGKAYTFTTWDGCSESNPDKKICKVKVDKDAAKTATAVYELAQPAGVKRPTSSNQGAANKTNDQTCAVSTVTTASLGVGIGRAIYSSTVKDSLCTLRLANPPAAGFQISPKVSYTEINYVDCADDCDKYDQHSASTYYNWYRIVNLMRCRQLASPPTDALGGCENVINQSDGLIRAPGGYVGVHAFEQFDEYYGTKGNGCKNYYCATRSTFLGWQLTYAPSTAGAHTMVNVVGKYRLDIFYDAAGYVSTPETDVRRDQLKAAFERF